MLGYQPIGIFFVSYQGQQIEYVFAKRINSTFEKQFKYLITGTVGT